MTISNTISKNNIQNQNIRNESVEKKFETIITKNNNTIPTQSSIPPQTQTIKSDIEEKISTAKSDPTIFKKLMIKKCQ